MLTTFVLAAMLAAPSEPATVSEIQGQVEGHLETFQAKLAYVRTLLEGGAFENGLLRPDAGMTIKSMPTPDAQGLHPLEVLAVLPGEPAAEVGIQPGDRITFIGQRRIEHETTEIAYMLLGKANPLSLTVLRGQDGFCFAVTRRPLRCVQWAIEQFDRTKWVQSIEQYQQQTTRLQEVLKQLPDNIDLLRKILHELQTMDLMLPVILEDMEDSLLDFASITCNPNAPEEE